MTDHRMNLDLITDMFGLLNRHGYARGGNEHTGRAILLLGDPTRIYEGSQDHPFGPSINQPPPQAESAPPAPAAHLRSVEQAYRMAIQRDAGALPPEPTTACRSPEHAADREIELE